MSFHIDQDAGSLYPFASNYFGRNGLLQHFVDEGDGEPIVMLHGNPTWSFYYRDLIKGLRDSHRVIAPDHIGCGLSDKPIDRRYSYTLKSRIDDLEALLDHLSLRENLTLVLHDWGGAVGMGYATRHPERIKRLVILNTAAFLLPDGKAFPWMLSVARNSKLGAFLILGFNAFSYMATYLACVKPMADEIRRGYIGPYDSWNHRLATLRFVQDIPVDPHDLAYPILEEIQSSLPKFADLPALICWGERDFVFDRDYLREWRRYLPHAETHTFSDAGHYVLEDACPKILPLIRDFLRKHPLGRAR